MKFISIDIPFQADEDCVKVELSFYFKGKISVYTSQTENHPYVENAENDYMTARNYLLTTTTNFELNVRRLGEGSSPVKEKLYIGIYGENSSTFDF